GTLCRLCGAVFSTDCGEVLCASCSRSYYQCDDCGTVHLEDDCPECERRYEAASKMEFTLTTYSDGTGGPAHDAIHIPWPVLERVLGTPYAGGPAQEAAITAALLVAGAPAWVKDANEGWTDEEGYGLIGPVTEIPGG